MGPRQQLYLLMATFRFAPDILRRLGEELNPSLEHGVIELVKNSRDADALSCEIRLGRCDDTRRRHFCGRRRRRDDRR